LQGWK